MDGCENKGDRKVGPDWEKWGAVDSWGRNCGAVLREGTGHVSTFIKFITRAARVLGKRVILRVADAKPRN